MNNKINYNLVNVLLFMIIFYIIVITSNYWKQFLLKIFNILTPFLLAFIIAYILNLFVKRLECNGIKKSLAIIIVILITTIILGTILWIILPTIYKELLTFSKTITDLITNVSNYLNFEIDGLKTTIIDNMNELIKILGNFISNGTIYVVEKSINFITTTLIVIILTIYLLIDMDKIRAFIKKIAKPHKNSYIYLRKIDHEMSSYLQGLAISMIIQLIEYSVLFKLINHPNWLVLGLLASITTVIPYFGGIFTNIVAIFTASIISTKLLIGTLIIVLVFSNIDGYVISPHIYEKTNNINPLIVIIMTIICSNLFGILGIMFALPLYLIIRSFIESFGIDLRNYRKRIINN